MKFNVLIKALVPLSVLSHPTSATMSGLTTSRDEISTIQRSAFHVRLKVRRATNTSVTLIIVTAFSSKVSILPLTVRNVCYMTDRSASCEVVWTGRGACVPTIAVLPSGATIPIQRFSGRASSKQPVGDAITPMS